MSQSAKSKKEKAIENFEKDHEISIESKNQPDLSHDEKEIYI